MASSFELTFISWYRLYIYKQEVCQKYFVFKSCQPSHYVLCSLDSL